MELHLGHNVGGDDANDGLKEVFLAGLIVIETTNQCLTRVLLDLVNKRDFLLEEVEK
tara:strand:+ start:1179 stop:1349 length:171 start_codon:yes stop_codon:yes gene_type:complete